MGAMCAGLSAVAQQPSPVLPTGVEAVWDMGRAYHETTVTRERICLNGLWQWQPAGPASETVPAGDWGYFKVPGCWPGITDYMQKDCQRVFAHPSWTNVNFGGVSRAWYRREFQIPENWTGRRIALNVEYLNSFAAVYVNGEAAGEIHFPGGELEITNVLRPGTTNSLALLVIAMPLKGVMLSYTDSASAREVKGSVARRGLCGDVFLTSTPREARLDDVRVETSVRKGECKFDVAMAGLKSGGKYQLRATVSQNGRGRKIIASPAFQAGDLKEGRMEFSGKWMPDKLWDVDTPQNLCALELSLVDSAGRMLDTQWPVKFGFREFWIDGRDFYLNGTRIFLSAVPLDNAEVSAGLATYDAARESLERLKTFGINFVYTHNYGCEPGSHLGFEEILRAADDTGMLVSFSQPHFSHYDWKGTNADQTNGYARHAEYYVRAAQNHPSVVMYSMSHNATGYDEDMNPDMIDGIHDARDQWAQRNVAMALRAEAIVQHFDPSRIVYHHASGNLGSMHAINFYPNFIPAQELSDWFEHWAKDGVKPVFTCEYGAPFTWDWTMYRGWYKGQREWGSAVVPWEFCLAEWNAQFFGDRAYQISEAEKQNLRWEAKQFEAGKVWHRWDYPNEVGSSRFTERYPVFAAYITDNWRAFRTWGVSANSPWEYGHFWKLRDGVDKSRRELNVYWANLQRPGFSPDYEGERYERMDLAYKLSDWIPTPAAEALIRNNRPLLAWIAGKPDAFTSKDHDFRAGEMVEKQLIIINNSRKVVDCNCEWKFDLPRPQTGKTRVTVAAGDQKRILLRFKLPAELEAKSYELNATAKFSTGEMQTDSFAIHIMAAPTVTRAKERIAVFDPKGETTTLLKSLGIETESIGADTDLSGHDVLIIGKGALSADGPAPDLVRVRAGLKVIVFEQTSEALEKRLGFRVEEYGLRQVFARAPNHPAFAGISTDNLRDWRGEATLTPSRLKYEMVPRHGPTVSWAGIPESRAWRCGNRGNVASVLIEKPACGDFLPIVDGGFSLQFSPLLEYREGGGVVIFCQLDVTGRTEAEPAAESLVRNLLQYISTWNPAPRRTVLYAGNDAGRKHLESAGFSVLPYDGRLPSADQMLVLGAGFANQKNAIADWLNAGGNVLAIGLDDNGVRALGQPNVTINNAEHISFWFDAAKLNPLFAGIGPADVHTRAPHELPLISGGAEIAGDGILARAENTNLVFCQIEPWQFASGHQNVKRTYRHTSFLLSRLLTNIGAASTTPLLERFHQPVSNAKAEQRWLSGFYLDQPEEWDDPYRFFRW